MARDMSKALAGLKKPSEGHKPQNAHAAAAVHALGRTKVTGNFSRIEKSKGKAAAIGAYQAVLAKHKAGR
jgi:hypothetical protein